MLRVATSLRDIIDLLYASSCFLSDEAKRDLRAHLLRLGQHHQALQVMELNEGRPRWKTTVKLHYVVGHLGSQADLINPRYVQGYRSESMVGQVCGIYAASDSGPHTQVQRVTMQKYRTGLKLLWV